MAAAATSRQDLPPKTPARTAPAKDHPPLRVRSEERKGEGLPCRLPIGGCTSEAAERGRGAEQKGGRNLPKEGVDRERGVGFSSARKGFCRRLKRFCRLLEEVWRLLE